MTGSQQDRAWGSVLSVEGFAAIRSVGFEPVGQVFGAAVYPLSVMTGLGCPGMGTRHGLRSASAAAADSGMTVVSGSGVPGPAARIAQALYDGRRTAVDRMTAECADLGGHGIVGASIQVMAVPAELLTTGAVEFTVMGTAVRAPGCPPPSRPFACGLSGQDFAKLIAAGWLPAGITLGISVAARHDDLLVTDRSRWGQANAEVAAYTDLIISVRQDARAQLEQDARAFGADGVIAAAMTLGLRGDACQAHPGGTDHVAQAVITGTAITRFSSHSAPTRPSSLTVLTLADRR
jgi:uncharacterized protein YbjQ (UPF0145 family)